MATIADFTEDLIKAEFEGFDPAAGIVKDEGEEFACVKFQTVSWEQEPLTCKSPDQADGECYRHSVASRLVKRFIHHMKIFDKVTGILLGNTTEQAVRESSKLGAQAFVSGMNAEACRLFTSAFKNADVDSEEEKYNRMLLNVTKLFMEAQEDLRKKRHENYILKMQNAYLNCPSALMKSIIGDRRNSQAEIFSVMAEDAFRARNFKEAQEFYKLAHKLCTEEYPKKDEYGHVSKTMPS